MKRSCLWFCGEHLSLFCLHCELASSSVNIGVYSWYWTTDTAAWTGGEGGREGREEGGREGGKRGNGEEEGENSHSVP